MMGLQFTGHAPFHTVYLHGIIRDGDGSKMSKTLGNVIDPLDVMDEFGTDAIRFTLLTGSTPGNDMNLSLERVAANRNFANKLWNATRLVLLSLERAPAAHEAPPAPTAADEWILTRAERVGVDVNRLFENYQFGEAGRQVYEFFWSEFADWYLEIAKLQLDQGDGRAWLTANTMVEVLDLCLRLLHPFTPFVTEELWGHLRQACQGHPAGFEPELGWQEALIVAKWPDQFDFSKEIQENAESFELVMDLIRAIRNIRSEREVPASRLIGASVGAGEHLGLIESQRETIAALARIDGDRLLISKTIEQPPQSAAPLVVGPIEAFLSLAELLDPGAEQSRLEGELKEVEAQIARLEKLLGSEFSEKAPAEVVEKERDRLMTHRATRDRIRDQLKGLGG